MPPQEGLGCLMSTEQTLRAVDHKFLNGVLLCEPHYRYEFGRITSGASSDSIPERTVRAVKGKRLGVLKAALCTGTVCGSTVQ